MRQWWLLYGDYGKKQISAMQILRFRVHIVLSAYRVPRHDLFAPRVHCWLFMTLFPPLDLACTILEKYGEQHGRRSVCVSAIGSTRADRRWLPAVHEYEHTCTPRYCVRAFGSPNSTKPGSRQGLGAAGKPWRIRISPDPAQTGHACQRRPAVAQPARTALQTSLLGRQTLAARPAAM